jgi:HSP20 family protein
LGGGRGPPPPQPHNKDTGRGGHKKNTLVRWNRATNNRTMPHEMSRLVNEFIRDGSQYNGTRKQGSRTPAVDMHEDDEAFTLTAELPGFAKDDVQVEIKGNRLTLKGERKRETDVQETQYHRVERVYGAFERSIRLPTVVDADKAKAIFKDGMLKLMLPKTEDAKPKPISITA